MPTTAPDPLDVERRKRVRIRIRRDLAIAPQKYEGRTYYVVKDPVSMRYYRFKEQEHFLINMMDGSTTLDDAQKSYESRFRPERLTLEDLEGFAQQLLTAGLAQNESPQAGKQLFDRRRKRRRNEILQAFTNILYIKIPVTNLLVYFNLDLDKLLAKMLNYVGWIFTTWFMLVSVAVFSAAIIHVATHFEVFRSKLPSYHEFFTFSTVGYLWLALAVVKVIHEFGHGLSCKAFGGEVHEMGLLFLVFSPCMYCNVSDAWTLPSKWKRIIISFAGIYVELIIAALATFVWWYSPSYPFVHHLSLSLMVVCSVSTVVFNANPLMRYDGYYMLADWLEIPNLRDRSNRFLQRLVMEHCLGIEVQPEPYMALWRRILFVAYAIISYIYRWLVTFTILYFMSQFLEPYKLGVVSGMMALFAAGSMVGWPIFRLCKGIHRRGRLPDMKPVRVTLTTIALAALIFCFLFLPLPVSRVRELGLVQIAPESIKLAVVPSPGGILDELRVRDGQRVNKGDVLAVFRNLEIENLLTEQQAERDRYRKEGEGLQRQLATQAELSQENKTKIAVQLATAVGGVKAATEMLHTLEKHQDGLTLRAPIDGLVMSPPRIDEVGRLFEKGAVFCKVGKPQDLRVLVPVEPVDYQLLRDENKVQADLPVTLRVHGHGGTTWQGEIALWPDSEAKQLPIQLTSKGGGNIAVKPASQPDPNGLAPQSQVYLLGIKILKPDATIVPGTMANVKVHCKWRSMAWWTWRSFCSLFDLGMDPAQWITGG